MKKIVFLCILLIIFSCSLVLASSKLNVVTTTTDLESISKEIGKDLIKVISLGKGYENPHFIQAKPSHILKLQKADLFIKIGLDLELWAPILIEGARNHKIYPGELGHIDASRGAEILEIPTEKIDRGSGDIHFYGNPHYWLDPLNGKIIANNIASALKINLPQSEKIIEENLKEFKEKINKNLLKWQKEMLPYKGMKIITYHNSFPNLAKRFGLNIVGYVEPKPGISPSPSHIASLIQLIKQQQVKLILMEPYFSDKLPKMIARETGSKVIIIPPSVGGVSEVKNYFDLFDYILNKIIEALKS